MFFLFLIETTEKTARRDGRHAIDAIKTVETCAALVATAVQL